MTRHDGRAPDQLRDVQITIGYMPYAEGSCLIEMNNTKIICTATIDDSVPRWMPDGGLAGSLPSTR
jgi:ribonuclease PH